MAPLKGELSRAQRVTEGSLSNVALSYRGLTHAPKATKKPPKPDGSHHKIHALYKKGDDIPHQLCHSMYNFNPRPPCGGRQKLPVQIVGIVAISIHALRVEGEICSVFYSRETAVISIHALNMEGDNRHARPAATNPDFNPRPHRGGRPDTAEAYDHWELFQSTPSLWRAT